MSCELQSSSYAGKGIAKWSSGVTQKVQQELWSMPFARMKMGFFHRIRQRLVKEVWDQPNAFISRVRA